MGRRAMTALMTALLVVGPELGALAAAVSYGWRICFRSFQRVIRTARSSDTADRDPRLAHRRRCRYGLRAGLITSRCSVKLW